MRMGLCFTPALWIEVWSSKKAGFNWESGFIRQAEGKAGHKEARRLSQKQEPVSILIKLNQRKEGIPGVKTHEKLGDQWFLKAGEVKMLL